MKGTQHLRNQQQHKYAKLHKFQVVDTIIIKTKDSFKPRNSDPFPIVNVLLNVLISVKNSENEIAQPFTINTDRVLPAHKRK